MLSQSKNKPIEAVLFDLDGTLLRSRMTELIPRYVEGLAADCVDFVKPKRFIKAKISAIRELIQTAGDGSLTIEERLYAIMQRELGLPPARLQQSLDHFQSHELASLQELVRPIPLAKQILLECREQGVPLVLATNPVFPRFMVQARMDWGEIDGGFFRSITTYENSRFCKPQAGYFLEIAAFLGVPPEHCLMVGNDLNHDLAAVAVGMETFLVDTWLVERGDPAWPCAQRGDHQQLQEFLRANLR